MNVDPPPPNAFPISDVLPFRSIPLLRFIFSKKNPKIQIFRFQKKRDQLLVKLLRYYRPQDVPEVSFSLIVQERIEGGLNP